MTERVLQNLLSEGLEKYGLFYGAYPGIVVSQDDPDKMGRIQASCADVWGSETYTEWIPPRSVFAGKGIGILAIPNEGDGVWITFRNGNPEYPMWEYRGWVKDALPEAAKKDYPKVLTIQYGKLRIELDTAENKIFMGNDTYSLNEFFVELIDLLMTSTTSTMLGPQPFINQVEWQALKQKLTTNLIK